MYQPIVIFSLPTSASVYQSPVYDGSAAVSRDCFAAAADLLRLCDVGRRATVADRSFAAASAAHAPSYERMLAAASRRAKMSDKHAGRNDRAAGHVRRPFAVMAHVLAEEHDQHERRQRQQPGEAEEHR